MQPARAVHLSRPHKLVRGGGAVKQLNFSKETLDFIHKLTAQALKRAIAEGKLKPDAG